MAKYKKTSVSPAAAQALVRQVVGNNHYTAAAIAFASPIAIPQLPWEMCCVSVKILFEEDDLINLVRDYGTNSKTRKPYPDGMGRTSTASSFRAWVERNQRVPSNGAGAWLRINSVDDDGISDRNVTRYRHVLVESDVLPIADQLDFFGSVKLPISALVHSGGKSIHAWVRVDAADAAEFRECADKLFRSQYLKDFGVDPTCRNPARLARLPGALRSCDVDRPTIQQLLYLDPNPNPLGIFAPHGTH